jgi:phenylacetic acid degradation operon negative regulatory protein
VLLPEGWPGTRAAAVFRTLRRAWERQAGELAENALESIVDE